MTSIRHIGRTQRFGTLLGRLSRLSTARGADAYRDIAWDDPSMALDPTDARLALPADDPLADTDWYRSLAPEQRARVGLARTAASFRTGWQFENLLQQGLLHRALYLRDFDTGGQTDVTADRVVDSATEFRYLHHEIIEESQHTLMFEEFVQRSGLPVRGMPRWLRGFTEWLLRVLSRHSPVVFFAMVLGGEEPLDLIQRRTLAAGNHPLVERIMSLHIAEETRHISYARAAIERDVAALHPARRHTVAFFTPVALAVMVRLMLRPTHDLIGAGVPKNVLVDMYRSAPGRRHLVDALEGVRSLFVELDMVTPAAKLVWRAGGIWG